MADLYDRISRALADRYAVAEEIGRGGMATVFLAEDLRHRRSVAIKVMHPEIASTVGTGRFLREIEISAQLEHPHILTLIDSGEADGLPFFVMPFVGGESLSERLARAGPLPVEEAVSIALEVVDALGYAHRRGVVHRDIKPGNILLEEGHAIVTDFGVARAISLAGAHQLTQTGLAVGSPAYMSPEQIGAGGKVDGRSDIYALGCVLYEMLSGKPPFEGPTIQAVLVQHLQAEPPFRDALREAPPPVARVVRTAMAKKPTERFSSAVAFSDALLGGRSVVPGRRGAAWSSEAWSSRRVGAVVAAGLVLAVAVALVFVLRYGGGERFPAGRGTTIMVAPFTWSASGDDSDSRSEELTRVLSGALATVPGLSLLEPAPPEGTGGRPLRAELYLGEAAQMGAGYLVTGEILGLEGAREVSVVRYALPGGERSVWRGEGASQEELDAETGRIAMELARDIAERERLDLRGTRGLLYGTDSPAALSHALQGQGRFWAEDFESSAAAFERAVQTDSAFALAWHRLSVAHVWRWEYPDAHSAAERGLALIGRPSSPVRSLLESQRQYALQHADSSVAAFQLAVLSDSSSIDAWLGLGESLFHFGGITGHCPTDARPAFARVIRIQRDFAPIHAHVIHMALLSGDSVDARTSLPWVGTEERAIQELAVDLRFGSPAVRAAVLDSVSRASRQTLSALVYLFAAGALDLPLADTLAGFLAAGGALTPDDRRRGAQYLFVIRAASGRWDDAVAAWKPFADQAPFDRWVIAAQLAGYPADALAEPMFAWAGSLLRQPGVPDLSRPAWDESRQAVRALVHRATLSGDSAETSSLIRRLREAMARGYSVADPSPPALLASLEGRLALLARDTASAIRLLEESASRGARPLEAYYPLATLAPQRDLLIRLFEATNNAAGAARWTRSFSGDLSLGSLLYLNRIRPKPGGGGPRLCAPLDAR